MVAPVGAPLSLAPAAASTGTSAAGAATGLLGFLGGPWGTLAMLGASVGLQILSSQFADEPPTEAVEEPPPPNVTKTVENDGSVLRKVSFGQVRISGSYVVGFTSDVKPNGTLHSGDRQNRYVDELFAHGDQPFAELERLILDERFTSLGSTSGTMGAAVGRYNRGGEDHYWIKPYLGEEDQAADQRLIDVAAELPDDAQGEKRWTSAYRARGMALLRHTGYYHEKAFGGAIPEPSAVWKTGRYYDPRKDTTTGGSGAHRRADRSTHEYSNLAAIHAANLILGIKVNGQHFAGLPATLDRHVDYASFRTAAAVCAEAVALKEGGTETRYEHHAQYDTDQAVADMLRGPLAAMAGKLCWTGYRWRLFAGAAQTPVATITDGDVLISEAADWEPKRSGFDLVNSVVGTYTERADEYASKAATPRRNEILEAEDGRRLERSLELECVQSHSQWRRLADILVKQARQQVRHRIVLPQAFFGIEEGDWVEWNSDRFGYSAKTFAVERVAYTNDLKLVATLQETSEAVYSWTPASDEPSNDLREGQVAGYDGDEPVDEAITPTAVAIVLEESGEDEFADQVLRVQLPASVVDNSRLQKIAVYTRKFGATAWNVDFADDLSLLYVQSRALKPKTVHEWAIQPIYDTGPGPMSIPVSIETNRRRIRRAALNKQGDPGGPSVDRPEIENNAVTTYAIGGNGNNTNITNGNPQEAFGFNVNLLEGTLIFGTVNLAGLGNPSSDPADEASISISLNVQPVGDNSYNPGDAIFACNVDLRPSKWMQVTLPGVKAKAEGPRRVGIYLWKNTGVNGQKRNAFIHLLSRAK